MAYEKQYFLDGQIVTADHLNHMENGIVAAADAETLGGKAPAYYLQPRNLLDNSDFTNSVNQRGVTNVSTSGYSIDRWIFGVSGTGALNMQYGMAQLNASEGSYCDISQIQENSSALSGKSMTLAVCLASCEMMLLNFTYGTAASIESTDGKISLIHYNGDRVFIRVANSGSDWISFQWAALYEGSYTADTLPPYVPKGYAAELAECQRYFWRCSNTYFSEGCGYAFSATECRMSIVTPQTFRTTPTMFADNGDTTYYGIRVMHASSSLVPTGVTVRSNNNRIDLTINGSWTTGTIIVLRLESALNFSADL